jgi:hypothetical protein
MQAGIDKPSARLFWCPVGSLVGIASIPIIAYQCWLCTMVKSQPFDRQMLAVLIIISLVSLWIRCLLIFASEVLDRMATASDQETGTAELPFLRDHSELEEAIRDYESDATARALVDVRWKNVRRIVWMRERALPVVDLATVAIVAFWIIPRCNLVCPDPLHLRVWDWCIGVYKQVGPLGLLCLALASTLARSRYPRPFRAYQDDYRRILDARIRWARAGRTNQS